ncbi:MAG: hypothetical protein ACP5F1_02755 [Thermoplasmata archaeon]|nr:hypothetical protein [Thermoplasmata archaeon]
MLVCVHCGKIIYSGNPDHISYGLCEMCDEKDLSETEKKFLEKQLKMQKKIKHSK